jgi:hypothetical protein
MGCSVPSNGFKFIALGQMKSADMANLALASKDMLCSTQATLLAVVKLRVIKLTAIPRKLE